MDPEEVVNLFDSWWFTHEIFKNPSNSETNPDRQNHENPQKPEISRFPTIHIRSKSEELSSKTSFNFNSLSPNSVLSVPHLQTIRSGKVAFQEESSRTEQVVEEQPPKKASEMRRRRRKKKRESGISSGFPNGRSRVQASVEAVCVSIALPFKKKKKKKKKRESKSLSALEFEELKGFMDLGFVFSEEDEDSSLVDIIPGLQRLAKKKEGEEQEITTSDESSVQRPYLSEAWEIWDRRNRERRLMNWRIPNLVNEVDMKDSLKCWAHTVASAVR